MEHGPLTGSRQIGRSPQVLFSKLFATVNCTLFKMRAVAITATFLAGASALSFEQYRRMPPGALEREFALQSAPVIPFKNFSAAYVKKALSQPINWTALGAVTPVKDQGAHGYCGTFGRVGACEGQLAIKKGLLVSLAEEELIDCIGWDQDQVQ